MIPAAAEHINGDECDRPPWDHASAEECGEILLAVRHHHERIFGCLLGDRPDDPTARLEYDQRLSIAVAAVWAERYPTPETTLGRDCALLYALRVEAERCLRESAEGEWSQRTAEADRLLDVLDLIANDPERRQRFVAAVGKLREPVSGRIIRELRNDVADLRRRFEEAGRDLARDLPGAVKELVRRALAEGAPA